MKAMQRLRKIFYFAKNTGLNIPDPFWDFNIGFETVEREYLNQKEIEAIRTKELQPKGLNKSGIYSFLVAIQAFLMLI